MDEDNNIIDQMIFEKDAEEEMKESYLTYAMSVIISRALPDARDGLKPSQRRILVAMNDLNLGPRSKYRKCAKIAGDEGRHEKAYQSFCTEILKRDPDGLLMEFGDMMRGQIVMPAELMTDGKDAQLYENFSAVAQRLGVYTAIDYADIIQHLVDHWKIGELTGLSSEAEKEQGD